MTDTAICVPVYQAARRFLPEFNAALIAAALPHRAAVHLTVDDLAEPDADFAPLAEAGLEVAIQHAPPRSSPAEVREAMLHAAIRSEAEILVFTDFDDLLQPDAVVTHKDALGDAEFSYGDQLLVDVAGRAMGSSLYAAWQVPEAVSDPAVLLDGNFAGFSGAAIRRSFLASAFRSIPASVKATDWYVFNSLLFAGGRGRRCRKPVVRYRQWTGNIHGGHRVSSDLHDFGQRRVIAERHFRALPDVPDVLRRRRAIDRLGQIIADNPPSLQPAIDKACERPAFWYADVVGLALTLLSTEEIESA